MSDVRAKKMSKKRVTSAPDLKCLPTTTEAFAQYVSRAHLQSAIWRSALSLYPPSIEVTQNGWSKDEAPKTLIPVMTPSDVVLTPPNILQMIRYGCALDEPCRNAQCGCEAAHLPCTFFCSCRGERNFCRNLFNKQTEEADKGSSDNDDDDDDGILSP